MEFVPAGGRLLDLHPRRVNISFPFMTLFILHVISLRNYYLLVEF